MACAVYQESTGMTLNERFTNLRQGVVIPAAAHSAHRYISAQMVYNQLSRRFGQYPPNSPVVIAAAKIKKRTLLQRLNGFGSWRGQRGFQTYIPRGYGRGRSFARGQYGGGRTIMSLRTPQMDNLVTIIPAANLRNGRGSGRRGIGYTNGRRNTWTATIGSGQGNGLSGRNNAQNGRGQIRGRSRANGGRTSNRGRGVNRARGGMRGRRSNRGRGANFRGNTRSTVPSREQLDLELDEYMSSTRSHLDKQLEAYRNHMNDEDVEMME